MALIGNWKPSDLSDIDVNQNGVVDDLDRTSIMAYVTMVGILLFSADTICRKQRQRAERIM